MVQCTPWRVAASLNRYLNQLNALAPARSRTSDGSIGDEAHEAEGCSSHHNSCCTRWNGVWIVRARDFTHDPKNGANMHILAEALRQSRDPRIDYVIWNRQIFSSYWWGNVPPFAWRPYKGNNPHTLHMHKSVKAQQSLYDDVSPWAMGFGHIGEADDVAQYFYRIAGDPTGKVWVTDRIVRRGINNETELANFMALSGQTPPVAVWNANEGNAPIDLDALWDAMIKSGEDAAELKADVAAVQTDVDEIQEGVIDLRARPSVEPTPVDAATLAAAMDSPEVRTILEDEAFDGAQRAEDV